VLVRLDAAQWLVEALFRRKNGDIRPIGFTLSCDVLRLRTRRDFELSSSPTAKITGGAGSPGSIGGGKAQYWRLFDFASRRPKQAGGRLFSEWAVYLRTSGLRGFSTVLKTI